MDTSSKSSKVNLFAVGNRLSVIYAFEAEITAPHEESQLLDYIITSELQNLHWSLLE